MGRNSYLICIALFAISCGIGVDYGLDDPTAFDPSREYPPPTLTTLSPGRGGRGTILTLEGSGFLQGATVSFATGSCRKLSVVSSTQITCLAPGMSAGGTDVTVANPDGKTATLATAYTHRSFLYVGGNVGSPFLAKFEVGESGALTSKTEISTGATYHLAVPADGGALYTNEESGGQNHVRSRTIDDSGELSGFITDTGTGTASLLAHPEEGFLYSAGTSTAINIYSQSSGGGLSLLNSVLSGFTSLGKLVMNASHLYLNRGASADFETFRTTPEGDLVSIGEVSGATSSTSAALHPNGNFFISLGNQLELFARNANDGTISFSSTEASQATGRDLAFSKNGEFLYFAKSDALRTLRFDPATGSITQLQEIAGTDFLTVRLDPGGRFLYTSWLDGSLHIYSIDSSSGLLTELATSPVTGVAAGVALVIR